MQDSNTCKFHKKKVFYINKRKDIDVNGKRGQIILLLKIILIGLFGAYIFNAVFHTSLASVVGFIVGAYIATKV